MKILTKTNLMASAVALLGFVAAPAMACEWGNACTADYTAGGGGFTNGGYEAWGGGENAGYGTVVDRGAFSESGGGFSGNYSFNGTTCDGDDCANFAQAGGEGYASQRSGSFIETEGAGAYSQAAGGAVGLGESGAYSWQNQPD